MSHTEKLEAATIVGVGPLGLILLVEDEALVAGGLSRQISAAGWRVRAAATVQSSLFAQKEPIDGAIVDLGLPDGSGFDVIDALRSHRRDVPVLVLTGARDAASINRAQRMGVEYACKPDAAENLRLFLERCTTSSRKRDSERVAKVVARHDPAHNTAAYLSESGDERSKVGACDGAVEAFIRVYEESKTADLFGFFDMARAAALIQRKGLLATVAERTGLRTRTLRSYALVGKFIRPEELRELGAFRDEAGDALTRRRLIQLAGTPRAQRNKILYTQDPRSRGSMPVKHDSKKDPEDPICDSK
jgi:ActR/RegA family two-component response regulator